MHHRNDRQSQFITVFMNLINARLETHCPETPPFDLEGHLRASQSDDERLFVLDDTGGFEVDAVVDAFRTVRRCAQEHISDPTEFSELCARIRARLNELHELREDEKKKSDDARDDRADARRIQTVEPFLGELLPGHRHKMQAFLRGLCGWLGHARSAGVYLFGPVARGTSRTWSDLHVAVVGDCFNSMPWTNRERTLALLDPSASVVPVGLTLGEYTVCDAAPPGGLHDRKRLIETIKNEGRLICTIRRDDA